VQGVPSRLVTGFVPDEIDSITGVYTVRAKDAHAWAEVYFPGVGWQAFDPTASVPLAGDAKHHSAASIWLRSGALLLALLGVGAVLTGGPAVFRLIRRLTAGRRTRRSRASADAAWATHAAATLDGLGRQARRPRSPSETTGAYASALSDVLEEPRLVAAGRVVDVATFASDPPPESERRAVDSLLAEVRARVRSASGRRRGKVHE
jgi:hypothetical protein